MASCQSMQNLLMYRYREQAHSYKGTRVIQKIWVNSQ